MNLPRLQINRFVVRSLLAAAAGAMTVALAACSAGPTEIDDGPNYPALPQSRAVDIQVVRDETDITLTNTTAAPLPPGRLWVNQWYSREFVGLGVGQTVTFDLAEFKDRYGAKLRSGGFWATEFADRLVQLQLHADDVVTGLVVIRPVD